jgi:hypothetical protein
VTAGPGPACQQAVRRTRVRRCIYPSERWFPPPPPLRAARAITPFISHQTTLPAGSWVRYQYQRAQRRHQEQPASSLFLRVGCAVFAGRAPDDGLAGYQVPFGAPERRA